MGVGGPPSSASPAGQIVVLAGGTGGAKLARGMQDVVGPGNLTVVANTGDDVEVYGAYVSPDPDLASFWLADAIDERGWGLHGDTFKTMDGLRELGVDVWFNLGDRDLAWCIERKRLLDEGVSPTAALARLNERLSLLQSAVAGRGEEPAGGPARVLPVSDDPIRTWVRGEHGWRSFQEFMIREQGKGMIDGLEFRGAEQAGPSAEVLAAIAGASAIVIGPSNPLASIGPILAVPGVREALSEAAAPVVAVSPIVGGEVLKGPTASFMAFAALECNATGIRDFYGELLNGIVSDEPAPEGGPEALQLDTRMSDPDARARVAEQVLGFTDSLA